MTYAPLVTNVTEWIAFSQKQVHWYEKSKEIFDQLEPGHNRTDEDVVDSIPPHVYRLDEKK